MLLRVDRVNARGASGRGKRGESLRDSENALPLKRIQKRVAGQQMWQKKIQGVFAGLSMMGIDTANPRGRVRHLDDVVTSH